jgi:hypothetical protein
MRVHRGLAVWTGVDESAEETAIAESLEAGVSGFDAAAQLFEDSRDLDRDRGLAVWLRDSSPMAISRNASVALCRITDVG